MDWGKCLSFEPIFNDVVLTTLENSLDGKNDDVFSMLQSRQSAKLAEALSHFLVKSWPKDTNKMLEFVLTLPAMKQYLSCFFVSHAKSTDGKNKDLLTEECKEKLAIAISLFEQMSRGISDGGITVGQLKIVLSKQKRFVELLQCEKRSEAMYQQAAANVKLREQELDCYERLRAQVATLVSFFKEAGPKCMEDLEEELKQAVDTMNIEKVWELRLHEEENITMKILTLDDKLANVLPEVNRLEKCRLFRFIWKEIIKSCKSPSRNIDGLLSDVWGRSVSLFEGLSSEMKSGNIRLQKVAHFFKETSSDEACMMTDLSFMGLEEEAAKQRCKQMQHFFSLEDAYRGATVIMRCKEDFHLTGDFQTLEALIDLTDCHAQLPWLKVVRESHGSMEVDALTLAENINRGGRYEVTMNHDANQAREDCNMNSVMKLHLKNSQGELCHYSYQQLRDLQSKIMLVAGQAEVARGQIQMFTELFSAIVRYSKIYVELCNTGCLLFKKWKTRFFCGDHLKKVHISFGSGTPAMTGSSQNVKEQVDLISNFMEQCLKEWR
ncbi:hypothetical protein CAPTEDRAFT_185662, partial [Capitella teleta]